MYMQKNTEFASPTVFYKLSEAHERLAQLHVDATRATAKDIGMNLKKGEPCNACTIAKENQTIKRV
jgi:hypothetical protein